MEHNFTETLEIKQKGNSFMFTLNQIEKWEPLKEYLLSLSQLKYALACKEIGNETHHTHIHCYVQCKNTWKPAISKSQGAHIDRCRGSPQQCINYLTKEYQHGEIIWEHGTRPHQGRQLSGDDIKKMSRQEIAEFDPRCARAYIYAKDVIENNKPITIQDLRNQNKDKEVYYFYGNPGAGKTERAKDYIEQLVQQNKCDNNISIITKSGNFWENKGAENATVALFDDFRDYYMPANEFIKLCGKETHIMNIKGSWQVNKYKYIFITNIQNPFTELYKDSPQEGKAQWLDGRRIQHFIYCYKENNEYKHKEVTWEEFKKQQQQNHLQ